MGVTLVTNPIVVQLIANAGFDALFIDLEHSTLSLAEASAIACAGLHSGLTPFVRVPYQCGMGFVQQVLDGGASGIVFPHVHTVADARAAVQTVKFPPLGLRSMWAQQPALGMRMTSLGRIVEICNSSASSVILMIEAADSVENIEEIAAVEGVDVLLVGCLDLSTDMGIPGRFDARQFRTALEKISMACRHHGKTMGLAGIYNKSEIQEWAINSLGVRFMLCQQDNNLLATAAMECASAMARIDRTRLPN